VTDLWLERWLARIGPAGSSRILELGCDDGRDTAYLAQRGYAVVATDISRAVGHKEIEPNFYAVAQRFGDRKRFFDKESVDRLFGAKWRRVAVEEMTIDRYDKPKVVWEVVLGKGGEAMKTWARKRIALCSVLALFAADGFAKDVEEVVDVPVSVKNMYGREFAQSVKVTVFRDDQRDKSPFLLLNHGRPAQSADFVKMGRQRYTESSRYFVSKGFAVFVPTRLGYGETGGEDVEYSGTCTQKNYPPAYEAAAQQGIKVIEYARAQPYVDANRGLVVGQSMGGAAAIALAAKNPPGVVAAVNFAGGGGGDPVGRAGNPCRADLMERLFASYGSAARMPTLWLYSENDKYWGKDIPHEWFSAFQRKGGAGEFLQLPPLPPSLGQDGHLTFTRNAEAWRPAFEDFLRRHGF